VIKQDDKVSTSPGSSTFQIVRKFVCG